MTVERSAANGDRFACRNRAGREGESPVFPVTRRENAVPLLRRRSSPAGACDHFSTNAQTKRVRTYVYTYNGPWPSSLDHLEFSNVFYMFLETAFGAIESGTFGIFNAFRVLLESLIASDINNITYCILIIVTLRRVSIY